MATMIIRHKVSNFENWKRVYDALGPTRKESNVISASVHRDGSDPNTVVIMHQFTDMPSALEFSNSPVLKTAMSRAGVISEPVLWFTEDIELTAH